MTKIKPHLEDIGNPPPWDKPDARVPEAAAWREHMIAWTCARLREARRRLAASTPVDAQLRLVHELIADAAKRQREERERLRLYEEARALYPGLPISPPAQPRGKYPRRTLPTKSARARAEWGLATVRQIWRRQYGCQNRRADALDGTADLAMEIVARWMSQADGGAYAAADIDNLRKHRGLKRKK